MNIGDITTETWGQPPISVYKLDSDGESLYAIELDDYYGELIAATYASGEILTMTPEDIEDIALFEQSLNEPTVAWKDIKEELSKDGLL